MLREFALPDLGEGLTESEIVAWRVVEGERVALNQIIADVETAKAVVELPSPVDGTVAQLHADAGDVVEVGSTIVTFEITGSSEPGDTNDQQAAEQEPNLVGYGSAPERTGRPRRRARADGPDSTPASTVSHGSGAPPPAIARARSTPPVRQLAQQLGVDLAQITGSGEGGVITRDDVVARTPQPLPAATASQPGALRERRVAIKGVRKHTAAAMVQSAFTAPHATCFLTVDVTQSMELIERLRQRRDLEGARVTILAVVARAMVIALRAHPELNSRWDEASREIVTFAHVNLGIAAATARGLVVPHIPDAHTRSLPELGSALEELTAQARAGTTPPQRLTGGTITISNLGVFGVDAGTPILNPGEAAILALGSVRSRPWEYRGDLALRKVMTLSLSFDHRVVDGAEAAQFLSRLGGLLEDPALAMLSDGGAPLDLGVSSGARS